MLIKENEFYKQPMQVIEQRAEEYCTLKCNEIAEKSRKQTDAIIVKVEELAKRYIEEKKNELVAEYEAKFKVISDDPEVKKYFKEFGEHTNC